MNGTHPMTENDKAYIAGLFDGEGSVSYYQRKEKRKGKKRAYDFWIIRCCGMDAQDSRSRNCL
jgi:hypothetical protein